jgi:RimJ/RimL family protein N-acetyltransferase
LAIVMSQRDVVLVPATLEHLRAFRQARDALGELLGSPIPDGWPEFPEAIDFTIAQLERDEVPAQWSMHFFLDGDGGRLVGSGGYAHPPAERTTEIGYEIAPAYRGRGYGTAAARGLVEQAFASGQVDTVLAHTLAEANPSTGVLAHLGFTMGGERAHPEVGTTWEWRIDRTGAGRADADR